MTRACTQAWSVVLGILTGRVGDLPSGGLIRMALKEVRGHEKALEQLTRGITARRVSHAYLFYGPEGIGKELVAKNFAKLLNCRSPEGDDACDFCVDCIRIEKGEHPDVNWFRPLGPARTISIEKVREFQKIVSLKPHSGKWKIGIFSDAHVMQQPAANALLKTLEEPPPKTVLILVTSRPEMLLPTVISRCHAVRFEAMRKDELRELLQSEYSVDSAQAEMLSRFTEGRLGEAIRALREDRLKEVTELHRDLGKRGYWAMVSGLLDMIDQSVERTEESLEWELAEKGLRDHGGDTEAGAMKEEIKAYRVGETRQRKEEILRELLAWYRDVLVWKLTGSTELLVSSRGGAHLEEQARRLTREQIDQAIRHVENALRYLRSNVNFHNLLENLLVQLSSL
jgi:DNA polymerase-3 subunit delta'